MKNRFLLLISAAFALCLGSQASAADGSYYDWSGYYIGGHFGYGFADSDWTLVNNAGGNSSGNVGKLMTTQEFDGILGGLQFGRNWQQGEFVYGLEGEISIPDLGGYSSWTNQTGDFRDATSDINWMASFTGRGGVTFDKTLVYVKGGLAFAGIDYDHTGGEAGRTRHLSSSEGAFGVVIGAGVEQALNDKWSLKFDYTFTHFTNGNAELTDGRRTAVFDVDQDIHALKVGVNYRF